MSAVFCYSDRSVASSPWFSSVWARQAASFVYATQWRLPQVFTASPLCFVAPLPLSPSLSVCVFLAIKCNGISYSSTMLCQSIYVSAESGIMLAIICSNIFRAAAREKCKQKLCRRTEVCIGCLYSIYKYIYRYLYVLTTIKRMSVHLMFNQLKIEVYIELCVRQKPVSSTSQLFDLRAVAASGLFCFPPAAPADPTYLPAC